MPAASAKTARTLSRLYATGFRVTLSAGQDAISILHDGLMKEKEPVRRQHLDGVDAAGWPARRAGDSSARERGGVGFGL